MSRRSPQLRLLPLPAGYKPPYDLDDAVDAVASAGDLARFARELSKDYREGDEEWLNDSLELFLEALTSAAEDLSDDQPAQWRDLAGLLLAATVRE
jgi:hypothetical protein